MEKFSFENLEVYQKSLKLSIQVCKLASQFNHKYRRIRDQLIGAITSVPLNIAEGSGKTTVKEKQQFYRFSRASSFECLPLLDICNSLNLISHNQKMYIREELVEISKMISGLINSFK